MKKTIVLLIMAFLVLGVTICQASPNPSTINVSAQVPTGTEFNFWMIKGDSKFTPGSADDTFTAATIMDYGLLDHWLDGSLKTEDAGVWFSQYYFGVFFSAITGGSKYKFFSTSSGLYNLTTKLPSTGDAWGVTFLGCRELVDDGLGGQKDIVKACPSGSSLGSPGPASVTDKLIFDSGAGAGFAIVRADFAIPPDVASGDPYPGWTGVPLSQKSGTYSGTLQIRMQTY